MCQSYSLDKTVPSSMMLRACKVSDMSAPEIDLSQNVLRRAVWRINEKCSFGERKSTKESINETIEHVRLAAERGDYDFSHFSSMEKGDADHPRTIKCFWSWQTENVLSTYLKFVLDSALNVKYANRKNVIKLLFNQLFLLKDFRNFTIIRFDFKDYFESISTKYVYEKFISEEIKDRNNAKLFTEYCSRIPRCYMGLPLSNAFAEIAGRAFDEQIQERFADDGLCYYTRYVDDCIMILNQRVTQDECISKIKLCVKDIFKDERIEAVRDSNVEVYGSGDKKFQYISDLEVETQHSFDFLGYEIFLERKEKQKLTLQYGITADKMEKYRKRIKSMFDQCPSIRDCELLRHMLQVFCRRTVYRKGVGKSLKWNVKGFISDYSELRFHLSNGELHSTTKKFLQAVIWRVSQEKFHDAPYFLKSEERSKPHPAYTLYDNMLNNRTLFFDPDFKMGIPRRTLIKRLRQIDSQAVIDDETSYHTILHKYLKHIWLAAE